MKSRIALAGVVPMLVAGGALFWMAVRPCEPVAQAHESLVTVPALERPLALQEPNVVVVPEITIVAGYPQGSRGSLAGVSNKPCRWSNDYPETNGWRDLDSDENGRVQVTSCK